MSKPGQLEPVTLQATALICTALTGSSFDPGAVEEVSERPAAYGAGWICGSADAYDREYCVDLRRLAAFLRKTQPGVAEALGLDEDSPTRRKFLARLQGEITRRGTIEVLRHGVKHGPHHIDLFYGTPSPGNPKARERYAANHSASPASFATAATKPNWPSTWRCSSTAFGRHLRAEEQPHQSSAAPAPAIVVRISQIRHLGRSVQVMARPGIYQPRRPQESALSLLSDGVWDKQGQFHPFGPLDYEVPTRLFQHHVLEMLISQRRLSREFADRLRSWHPSGFQVYCGPPVDRDDQPALERLSACVAVSPGRDSGTRPKPDGSSTAPTRESPPLWMLWTGSPWSPPTSPTLTSRWSVTTAAIPTPPAARDATKPSRRTRLQGLSSGQILLEPLHQSARFKLYSPLPLRYTHLAGKDIPIN
jgi:hypothetical protein